MYNVNYRKKAKILTNTTFKMNTNIRFSMKKPRVKVKNFFLTSIVDEANSIPGKRLGHILSPNLPKLII